jgi:chromosome segregation ATPase
MKEQIASLKKEKNDTLRDYQSMEEKLAENNERYNSELQTVRARVSELDTSNNELKQALREKEIEYESAVAEQMKTRTALQRCVDTSVKGVKDTAVDVF